MIHIKLYQHNNKNIVILLIGIRRYNRYLSQIYSQTKNQIKIPLQNATKKIARILLFALYYLRDQEL